MKKDLEARIEKLEEKVGDAAGDPAADVAQGIRDDLDTQTKQIKDELEGAVRTTDTWTTQLGLKILAHDVHNRKWCLVLHGLEGAMHERDYETVDKVIQFGTNKLGIPDTKIATAHRLN